MKTTCPSFIKHQETASKRGLKLKSTFHTNTSDKQAQESNFTPTFFDTKFELEHSGDSGLKEWYLKWGFFTIGRVQKQICKHFITLIR